MTPGEDAARRLEHRPRSGCLSLSALHQGFCPIRASLSMQHYRDRESQSFSAASISELFRQSSDSPSADVTPASLREQTSQLPDRLRTLASATNAGAVPVSAFRVPPEGILVETGRADVIIDDEMIKQKRCASLCNSVRIRARV